MSLKFEPGDTVNWKMLEAEFEEAAETLAALTLRAVVQGARCWCAVLLPLSERLKAIADKRLKNEDEEVPK